jgi:hypothetical protein
VSDGTPTGRFEHCQRCYLAFEVDELGRVPQHRKRTGSSWVGGVGSSMIAPDTCSKSNHPSREELQRRKEQRKLNRLDTAAKVKEDARVALDAFLEGRRVDEYEKHLKEWRRVALVAYNAAHGTKATHAYEYATSCAPQSRRAHTRGDIYCRFCGERLAVGVKDPHGVVAASDEAQRHLTTCALQLLAGMREPAKPGHRALPMEFTWSDRP